MQTHLLLTVFDLSDVSDHDLRHFDGAHLPRPDYGELLLLFDTTLQATELLLFAPVIKGRN